MVIMNAKAEIDKAGRLVVPKKMRDALHLIPGTRLTLVKKGDAIVLTSEASPRGLFMKNGLLVYGLGRPVSPDSIGWLKADREERTDKVSGTGKKA